MNSWYNVTDNLSVIKANQFQRCHFKPRDPVFSVHKSNDSVNTLKSVQRNSCNQPAKSPLDIYCAQYRIISSMHACP